MCVCVGGGDEYHCIFGIGVANFEVGPLEQIKLFFVCQPQPHRLIEFGLQAKALVLCQEDGEEGRCTSQRLQSSYIPIFIRFLPVPSSKIQEPLLVTTYIGVP